MPKQIEIKWLEATSSKTGKTYERIEYVFKDGEDEIALTTDFDMSDIKRYVLKQLGIKKETI